MNITFYNNRFNNYNNTASYKNFNPEFRGKSREVEKIVKDCMANPELKEKNSALLIEKILKALPDIMQATRAIGEGTRNRVQRATNEIALRIPLDFKLTKDNLEKLKNEKVEWGKNIFASLDRYYGEKIASIGENIQILRNVGVRHQPAGVPLHLAKTLSSGRLKKFYLEKYLPKFARLPQHSYNELANNLAKLNEMKFGPHSYGVFDSLNPNNIVASKGKLMLVDEIETLYDKPYGNTTAKLLEVFINRATAEIESPDVGDKLKLLRTIFKKTILASMNAGLIHADNKIDYKNWEVALKKCKISEQAFEVIQKIEAIEAMPLSKEEKRNIANKYLQNLFNRNHAK